MFVFTVIYYYNVLKITIVNYGGVNMSPKNIDYTNDNYTVDINGHIKPRETPYSQLNKFFNEGKIVRIAKYVRCSSDEQKKNGYTIGDQLALLDDFAVENGLVSYDNYIDEGISATLEIHKRKDLARLIEDAKAGKFDVVVFKCIDRFFRNVGEYYECQKQLNKAGVTWLSIEESDLDPNDPEAGFKINIYLTIAEYEAKKTSKRILFNNKNRIKNKQVVTGSNNFHFPWHVVGEPRNRRLARNMDRAEELYDLLEYFERHQSKKATIAYYNDKYNKIMTVNSLHSLLTDTLLYGEYKGVSDYVEPFITKERFDKIQEILKQTARYNEKTNNVYLFSGLIKCHKCGCSLSGSPYHRKNSTGYTYRCNGYRQRGICNYTLAINESIIESQLLDNLEQYINKSILHIKKVETKKEKPKKSKVESIKKEIARLNSMYRKGRIDEEEYDKDYLALENKLKIAEIEEGEPDKERDLTHLVELLDSDWRNIYARLDRQHKKAFWRKILKRFSIDDNRKIIEDSIIFF
jgi:DNA invertase Pin-like site-specific DNA recombinase